MNWEHVKAILWLRWRLRQRQFQRAGAINAAIAAVLLVFVGVASAGMFVAGLCLGLWLLPKAGADAIFYAWFALIGAFSFWWLVGLVAELQRSETLSFEKLLHFPISLSFAFLLDYFSSLASISLALFLPGTIGLSIASVAVMGPDMLVLFPLLGGFVLMVTAVTYQFRGWLAALMVNKRRRRSIIAVATVCLILMSQLPNVVNFTVGRTYRQKERVAFQEYTTKYQQLVQQLKERKITFQQYNEGFKALEAEREAQRRTERNIADQFTHWAQRVSIAVPPAWLAYGALEAARQRTWPGLLCSVGSLLIGAASLRRSHRAMLRFYRGESGAGRAARKKARPLAIGKQTAGFLDKKIPWISERAAAVALANFRSMLRAPEVKMAILTPFIVCILFISTLLTRKGFDFPVQVRPLLALAAIGVGMCGLMQLYQNQFGYDRDGFRALVLSPVPRGDVLFGKNLSLVPITCGVGIVAVAAMQFIVPMRITHLAAMLCQLIALHLIFCMVGNQVSIVLPMAVKAGSLKSAQPAFLVTFLRLLAGMAVTVVLVPISIPLGIEVLAEYLGWGGGMPIDLILSGLELAGVGLVYRWVLEHQGNLLQLREQRILEKVTAKND